MHKEIVRSVGNVDGPFSKVNALRLRYFDIQVEIARLQIEAANDANKERGDA